MIYFDHAATSFPKPPGVRRAMQHCLQHLGGNPGRGGHTMAMQSALAVHEVRRKAACMFGLSEEGVIFTANCTHALNYVIFGLLQQGDRVVTSDLEHNGVWRPLSLLQGRGVIDLVTVPVSFTDPGETAAAFERAILPGTKLVICTHASNVTGTVLPIARIAQAAHRCGGLMAVDAAQTAGMLALDAAEMGLDFICMPGHKGLYGPMGTGLLLAAGKQMLHPLLFGGTGSASASPEMPGFYPDRLECGTLNLCGICGLGAGMDYLAQEGIGAVYRREMALIQRIYRKLSRCNGVELYTPEPSPFRNAPLFSFNIRGLTGEETAARLCRAGFALRGGLHCAPLAHKKLGTMQRGTVRVSVGAHQTQEEADLLCAAVKKLQDTV